MKMENFNKVNANGVRKYKADLTVKDEEFIIMIDERYLTRGVEYNVKVKSKNAKGIFQTIRSKKKLPKLNKHEWYKLYFFYSNQQPLPK